MLKEAVKTCEIKYNIPIMKFRLPLLVIAAIAAIHIPLTFSGLYYRLTNIDILMHFAGGLAMGLLAIAIHHDMTDRHDLKGHPLWYHYLFVIGFVMLIGVAWEFHEYIFDNTLAIWYQWPKTQLDLADTMLDLVMDGVGGTTAFLLFKKGL